MAETAALPKLTVKQKRWLNAYLGEAHGNATLAAQIAGYSDATQSGYENKRNQDIRAHIDDRMNAESLSSAEVLAELTDVARAEWRDFLLIKRDKDGEVFDVRMDLSSKVKSLELLGKAHQLFTDRQIVEGDLVIREYVGLDPDEAV